MFSDYQSLIDPWEWQYLCGLDNVGAVPWTDQIAWSRYPELRKVYDKYLTALHWGDGAPKATGWALPGEYLRPKFNLQGMGYRTSRSWLPRRIPEGFFASKPYEGVHISTDFVIWGHRVLDYFSFQAHSHGGSFKLFESVPGHYVPEARMFAEQVAGVVPIAVVNVETIGTKVLEAHMRPSTQFFDISGGLLPQLPKLFVNGSQSDLWVPVRQEKTYSYVIRSRRDRRFSRAPDLTFTLVPKIRSVQLCFEPGIPLSAYTQDSSSFRVAVINGTDEGALSWAASELEDKLREVEIAPI